MKGFPYEAVFSTFHPSSLLHPLSLSFLFSSPTFSLSWTLPICTMCGAFPILPAECPVKAAVMVPFETTPSPPSGIPGIPCEQPHKV